MKHLTQKVLKIFFLVLFLFHCTPRDIVEPQEKVVAFPNPFIERLDVFFGRIQENEFPAELNFIDTRGNVIFSQQVVDSKQAITLTAPKDEPGQYAIVLKGINQTHTIQVTHVRNK